MTSELRPQKSPIPTHLVSGFLGTGKTTAVVRLLKQLSGKEKIVVIVNDFGAVDLDGAIMNSSGSANDDVRIMPVADGCVCCSAGDDLLGAISYAVHNLAPDRIVIEPTGLAEPAALWDLLREDEIIERLELRPIITFLHPQAYFRMRGNPSELAQTQIDAADILVANFADKTDPEVMEQFYGWVGGLYPPKMKILVTKFGELPLDILDWKKPASKVVTLPKLAVPSPAASEPHAKHEHEVAHPKDKTTQGQATSRTKEGFQGYGWQWPAGEEFSLPALEGLFLKLAQGEPAGVVRAKGIFRTSDGWVKLEVGSLRQLEMLPTAHRSDSRCDVIFFEPNHDPLPALEAAFSECQIPTKPLA